MNLYKESKEAHERDKRIRLRRLKRSLWFSGAKPKYWKYVYMKGTWKAFHVVDDMDIISQVISCASGYYLDYVVSYTENQKRREKSFSYWSSVKEFVGERIVEKK